MRYTVIWVPRAENALARFWVNSPNRQEVTNAADRTDRELKNDPERKGTQSGKFYERKDSPIAVLYHVAPMDRMVRVISVKLV